MYVNIKKMQTITSDINDLFTGNYPLDNLNKSNRWVKMADALDWTYIENRYNARLKNQHYGASNKPARMVVGALIVKHTLCLSDENTIQTILENPYMQYLVGLKYFSEAPIFTPELFVTLRKRIDETFFNEIMLSLHKGCTDRAGDDSNGECSGGCDSQDGSSEVLAETEVTHKGVMKIDATCTDAEVRFPTDINLLEDASRVIDRLIQKLSSMAHVAKPKTSRAEARSCFTCYIKQKHKKSKRLIRSTIERLLHLLSKDIQRFMDFIGCMSTDILSCLNRSDLRQLKALRMVYSQQKEMFDNHTHTCVDRIISIFQPHVRPIVRGKAKAKVEFGAKIGVSVTDGFTYIDHLSWEAYNESSDLLLQLNTYKERFGYYPKEVQADKLYLNKDNRKLLHSLGVTCHCAPLGRPPKTQDKEAEELRRKASASRNGVEATFGTAKRVYNANDIRAKLPETARTWIGACFFVKNLNKFLQGLICLLFQILNQNLIKPAILSRGYQSAVEDARYVRWEGGNI